MKLRAFALGVAVALTAVPALAQGQQGSGNMMQGGMMQNSMMMQGGMMGMHVMPVTVRAIDSKTGLVDGTSGGMALKLHFPPASLAKVKAGDKLQVHLSFTR